MTKITTDQARQIVNEIRERNGGLTPEDRSNTPASVLRVLENVLRQLGASTRALARDLYTSESRFVFELIQNAEDNSYNNAHNDDPFIKFTLTPGKIIVENNEDGFEEADVRSICKVGDSTKVNRVGYIGEKGIGFKSVFQVAHKVQIQSDPFNFSFEHRPDDTGMGMITPVNEEGQPLLNSGTRMTLFLLHTGDFNERVKDLSNIPDALILFLSKIKRIEVVLHREDDSSTRILHECYDDDNHDDHHSTVKVVKRVDEDISEKFFYVEGRTFDGLPSDTARRNRNRAEIILAFPVTSESKPIIESQLVFSFLPIRDFGFKFLIQSDFITAASRQDIRLCRWNDTLLENVAIVFSEAVDKFSSLPTIQYDWFYFLPGTGIVHEFWNRLHDMIITRLKKHPILLTRGGVRKLPGSLQRLSDRHCDKHGQPLFKDLQQEVYLSSKYRSEHTIYLQALGVANLSWDNIIARITPYLEGERPIFLQEVQDDDWHTRVANLLIRGLNATSGMNIQSKIRRLSLIPLRGGSLSDNLAYDIYFPFDHFGNHIPMDLGLKVVDENVFKNNTRKLLYQTLGVRYCQPSLVISHIVKRYNPPVNISLSNSVAHLKYLYQTLPDDQALDNCIFVMSQSEVPIYRRFVTFGRSIIVDDIYFGTNGDFGTKHLAQEFKSDRSENWTPGIYLLHDAYLEAVSLQEEVQSRPWKRWLENKALIRPVPRLRHSSTTSSGISSLFTIIINYRPQLLVGVLKRYWNSYKDNLSPAIVEAIRNAEVPCIATDTRRPLKATFLPTIQLTSICRQACVTDVFDVFLHLNISSGVIQTSSELEFLEVFGVGTKSDLNFFRTILSTLTDNITGLHLKTGLFYIYEQLFEEFGLHDRDSISDILNSLSAVCIPKRTVQATALTNCVWNGLHHLHVKDCLSQYAEYSENPNVRYLFQDILALGDAGCRTYIEELKYLQRPTSAGQLSFDNLCAIYAELLETTQVNEDWKFVQDAFEEHKLIYIPTSQGWVTPTSCVWADTSNVGGQYGIEAIYSNLQALFKEKLHIQTPTIANYIDQLRLVVTKDTPCIAEIKFAINRINELGPTRSNLDEMKQLKCLPVSILGATVELKKPSEVFFIADRREYEELFRGKAPILDFSLEEVHTMHPCLNALGLADRYMSVAVQETTMVQRRSESPSNTLSQAVQAKSKALYRCALHYQSTKTQSSGQEIYQKLRYALVYESDGFTKDLRLSCDDFTVNAVSDRGIFHLEDADDTLNLFVPRDNRQRDKCYLTQLPNALERYLLIDNPRASKSFLQVIQAPPHTSSGFLDELLDEDGIVRIPDNDLTSLEQEARSDSLVAGDYVDISVERLDSSYNDTTHDPPEEHIETNQNRSQSTLLSISNEVQSITSHSRSSSPYAAVHRAENTSRARSSTVDEGGDGVQDDLLPLTQVTQYVQILEKIITVARRTNIPSIFAQHALSAPASTFYEHDSVFGVRLQNQLAHDIKIGAAGELFVFEMLLQLCLPNFGRENWKSNIRKEIRVHPAYHDLDSWEGSEISDIIYNDSASVLTNILIENGYLPRNRWQSVTPKYLIEVKSTTGACESAFFMSKSQYRRMQSHKLDHSLAVPETTIYVIFRVFNLGKENMNLRVYVDPESLRQQQYLQFRAESYSVTVSTP